MGREIAPVILRGAAAGVTVSLVQAVIGKAEEKLLLPPWENTNIAPRFMARLAADLGQTLSPVERWTLGTGFHLGYGAFWGASYALIRERYPVHPVVGGTLLGGLIYFITFPRWGGAVQTQTERPPEERTSRMTFVAASVTLGFGILTALLYERLRGAPR